MTCEDITTHIFVLRKINVTLIGTNESICTVNLIANCCQQKTVIDQIYFEICKFPFIFY